MTTAVMRSEFQSCAESGHDTFEHDCSLFANNEFRRQNSAKRDFNKEKFFCEEEFGFY